MSLLSSRGSKSALTRLPETDLDQRHSSHRPFVFLLTRVEQRRLHSPQRVSRPDDEGESWFRNRNMGTDASGVHSCTGPPDLMRGRNSPSVVFPLSLTRSQTLANLKCDRYERNHGAYPCDDRFWLRHRQHRSSAVQLPRSCLPERGHCGE